ncbi:OPT/YSL family transporter [bacterium]|nr:OPT/YSL family transporter [bacterium]
MALNQLNEEQIRTWTLQQKDEWWLKNVYKGDMPQLTLRSALTGVILGMLLCLTNLYIGIRTGWTLGVGITAVVASYGVFRLLAKTKIATDMTILENNAMQSISASAGYVTSPLISAIPAYMMATGIIPQQWHVYCWAVALGILGTLIAFPLKKKFINDEQLPFPEGYAAGVVMESLHSSDAKVGVQRAKFLAAGAGTSALIEFLRSETVLTKIGARFLAIPHYWDEFIYKFYTPTILGTPMKDLLLRFDTSIVMMGAGTIMSMQTATSMLLGGLFNYAVLAPIMIQKGVIVGGGFRNISLWALWGGASMMTSASLYSFFAADSTVAGFKQIFKKNKVSKKEDILKDIELPISVSIIGVPIVGMALVVMGKAFFGVDYWLTAVAIPLVFAFSIMAVKATGLTGTTPGSALAKMTQAFYSLLAPGHLATNLTAAGVTSVVCLNASNLLMDIKPGYMLGAKPRQQAVGHILGVMAGSITAIPVFYMLFNGDINAFGTEKLPMPSAVVWKAVADVLSVGISSLHITSQYAVVIGAVLGIVMEILIKKTKGKFPISPVAFGLPFVLSFTDVFMMFLGAFLFWLLKKKPLQNRTAMYQAFVDNQESIGAGIIAGGSIIGIILLIIETAG